MKANKDRRSFFKNVGVWLTGLGIGSVASNADSSRPL